MGINLNNMIAEFISLEGIEVFTYWPNFLLVALTLVLFWVGKKIFEIFSSYSLEHQLVRADNKAVSVSFVGYLAGVAIILHGAIQGETNLLIEHFLDITIWGIIGIFLLNLAGKANDKFMLRYLDCSRQLTEKRNIGVGVTMAAGYLASAFIVRSIIVGESVGWTYDIILTALYFILAQFCFYLYSLIYQKVTRYDFHEEIKNGNVAAAISLSCNLVAIGVLLAIPLEKSFSLAIFAAWFVVGNVIMIVFRFIMDRIIIPMEKLDEEIHQDQNWGIAFLEGCFSLAAVVLLLVIFS